MPRYELVEGSSSKFWQIDLKGKLFTTTHGKIGSSGQTTLKEWPNADVAKKEYEKIIAQKVKKGYSLVGGDEKPAKAAKAAVEPAPTKAAKPAKKGAKAAATNDSGYNAALAKQIDADPTDVNAWSVYTDWLQGEGDPRGELGATQERLRAAPKDKALLSAEKKLLKEHAATLFPEQYLLYVKRKGALPSVLAKPELDPEFRQVTEGDPPIKILWRAGFIEHLTIGHPDYDWSPNGGGDDDDDAGDGEATEGGFEIEKALIEILAHPSARFLTSLRLGMPGDPDDGEQDYSNVIKTLAKLDATERLRTLFIGDIVQEQSENSWVELGDLSKLYPRLKNLRSLTLRGGSGLKLGKIELPELRELTIVTGGLDKKNIASIAAAKWPKLEHLELWLGTSNYGGNATAKDLATLLDGKAFPKLKYLGLRNAQMADEIAAVLPGAKILKQLDTLDLSKGCLTDTGVTAMLASTDAFSHLRKIDLSDNYVGKTSAAAAKLCKAVRTRPQRSADNYDGEVYRYVSLGE